MFLLTEVFIYLQCCAKYGINKEQWLTSDIIVYYRGPSSYLGRGEPISLYKRKTFIFLELTYILLIN